MPKTQSQKNTKESRGNEQSESQNTHHGPTQGEEGTELSWIPNEQLVEVVAENLSTFKAIVNYLRDKVEDRHDQETKTRKKGAKELSDLRQGVPAPDGNKDEEKLLMTKWKSLDLLIRTSEQTTSSLFRGSLGGNTLRSVKSILYGMNWIYC